jgi:hypothetical protein
MGFWNRLKEAKKRARDMQGYRYIIRTTVETTGCTVEESEKRFKLWQQSAFKDLGENHDDVKFQFVCDKYMTGEATNDTELLDLIYQHNNKVKSNG